MVPLWCFKPNRTATNSTCSFPVWQTWYKPLSDVSMAVLLVNNGNSTADVSVSVSALNLSCTGGCSVRSVWEHRDLGAKALGGGVFTATLTPHDSAFIVINASAQPEPELERQQGTADEPAPASANPPANLSWTDAASLVQNSGWNSSVARTPFARLPLAAKSGEWCDPPCPVRDIVWGEGQNGAGLVITFRSDAASIWLNATLLTAIKEAPNCAATCGSGLDMYAFDANTKKWRWVDTTKNNFGNGWSFVGTQITRAMVTDVPPSHDMVRYKIHLPIYNGLRTAAIGISSGQLLPDTPPPSDPPPILFYGTSIVNGHVASRPGMIFTNVLSRMLARDVINLGFGGNGEMEASIGRLIVEMKQVALVVIDCNW